MFNLVRVMNYSQQFAKLYFPHGLTLRLHDFLPFAIVAMCSQLTTAIKNYSGTFDSSCADFLEVFFLFCFVLRCQVVERKKRFLRFNPFLMCIGEFIKLYSRILQLT
jgi:hypothetical protein